MTTRKLFSICISAMVFGHAIDARACVGGGLVLAAIGYSVWRSWEEKMQQQQPIQQEEEDGVDMTTTTMEPTGRLAVDSQDYTDDGNDDDDDNSKNKRNRLDEEHATPSTAALAVQ